jgi:hypothetical protein
VPRFKEEHMEYQGPERRVHTIYRTNHREYHVRAGTCVAVRNRDNKIWISNHEAIGMDLDDSIIPEEVVGRPLEFLSPYAKMRTSKVINFERPERQTVDVYGLVWAVCPTGC